MQLARPIGGSALLLLCAAVSACWMRRGAEVNVLPEGFVGPVVVVYGIPGGEELPRDTRGAKVYRVPPNGVLFVKDPRPKPGWYEVSYVVEARDGTRHNLPSSEDLTPPKPNVFQVMGRRDGAAMRIDGVDVGELWYRAYYVGVPAKVAGWGEQLERFKDQVMRKAAALANAAQQTRSAP